MKSNHPMHRAVAWAWAALAAAMLVAASTPTISDAKSKDSKKSKSAASPYQDALNAAHAKYKDLQEGKNADYIPALAKVDPNIFGIALVTTDGKVYTTGDITSEVSIQSISKVFTMA